MPIVSFRLFASIISLTSNTETSTSTYPLKLCAIYPNTYLSHKKDCIIMNTVFKFIKLIINQSQSRFHSVRLPQIYLGFESFPH